LDRYCTALEDSDVAVFGITDYFSLTSFFAVKERYGNLFPNSAKVLFPNVELRLNESVNRDQQEVHIHLILRPDIDEPLGDKFLGRLMTELKENDDGPRRSCMELASTADYASATVSRKSIETAIEETFGKGRAQSENVLIVVAAGDSGNRPETGVRRKESLAEEIDRLSGAVFGNASNVEFFLDPTRGRDDCTAVAKPVFSGCDAHSFDQLNTLGKETGAPDQRPVTWIKADPTFEGLLQTLVEPGSRVQLGAARPDRKEPYKVIESIHFSGREDFPAHLMLNPNLVSVIGSRSSGKSALLAYIARSVDKDYTEAQQLAADPNAKEQGIGPAPGMTWGQVEDIDCRVKWAGGDGPGKVIYIPQNSLFWISEEPKEITAKILPTLYRLDPDFETAHRQMSAQVDAAGTEIRNAAGEWFRIAGEREASRSALRDLGDREAISETRKSLETEIEKLRVASSLSETETREYEELGQRLTAIDTREREIEAAAQLLAPHLIATNSGFEAASSVDATLRLVPAPVELPGALRAALETLIETTQEEARTKLANAISEYQVKLDEELGGLRQEREKLRTDNQALIEKNEANAEIEALVVEKKKQDEALERIEASSAEIEQQGKSLEAAVGRIEASIRDRQAAVDQLSNIFGPQRELKGEMGFSMEHQLSRMAQEALSNRLNRQHVSDFIDRDTGVRLEVCQEKVGEFLAAMYSGAQKVIKGQDREEVAIDVLLAGPEVRFTAEIEGDRIGGFEPSTMTPGKQALFALTLILNESEEAWPLLIDQPEDDLDSRSIYEVLVQYLCERKKERQIIMVSHNANLVIGADSEQVVVTNRHGDDRQNKDGRIFGYFSGSLEHSAEPKKGSAIAFELGGIREHACEILDGGEEAFRKRQEKYKFG